MWYVVLLVRSLEAVFLFSYWVRSIKLTYCNLQRGQRQWSVKCVLKADLCEALSLPSPIRVKMVCMTLQLVWSMICNTIQFNLMHPQYLHHINEYLHYSRVSPSVPKHFLKRVLYCLGNENWLEAGILCRNKTCMAGQIFTARPSFCVFVFAGLETCFSLAFIHDKYISSGFSV